MISLPIYGNSPLQETLTDLACERNCSFPDWNRLIYFRYLLVQARLWILQRGGTSGLDFEPETSLRTRKEVKAGKCFKYLKLFFVGIKLSQFVSVYSRLNFFREYQFFVFELRENRTLEKEGRILPIKSVCFLFSLFRLPILRKSRLTSWPLGILAFYLFLAEASFEMDASLVNPGRVRLKVGSGHSSRK